MAKKHWIYIKRGLSEDPKHRQAMGEAVWLFMHICDYADWEKGMVYDWRDKEIAAEMSLSLRTVREWRQRLVDFGYITCLQRQHCLDIIIHNWTNPRDYSGIKMNPRQGNTTVSPSNNEPESDLPGFTQDDAQGNTQGDTQGCHDSNGKQDSLIESESESISKSNTVPDSFPSPIPGTPLPNAPHSPEEARTRIQAALERGLARQAGKFTALQSIDLSWLPEGLRPLAEAFCDGFQRGPTKDERGYWLKELRNQSEMGLAAPDVTAAFGKMRHDGLSISSPKSVTAIAWEMHTGNGKSAQSSPAHPPQKILSSEEADAEFRRMNPHIKLFDQENKTP